MSLKHVERIYPFRRRIVRNVVLASAIIAFVTVTLVFVVSWRYLVGDAREQLLAMASDMRSSYQQCGGNTSAFGQLMDDYADEFNTPNIFLALTDARGELLRGTKMAGNVRSRLLTAIAAEAREGRLSVSGKVAREPIRAVRFRTIDLSDGNLITVALDVTALEEYLLFLVVTLLIAFLFMVGGAVVIAGTYAGRLARWLGTVADTASDIARGDWSRRVSEDGVRVREVVTLIQTFNDMCDKNERTLSELRTLTDDIAHDLRTPLSHLRMAAETEAAKEKPSDTLPDIVADETSAMLEMINTMLEISQNDARIDRTPRTVLDLSSAVRKVADLYQPVAEQGGVQLLTDLPPSRVPFTGHKGKIQQLLGNLVENAVKFTPRGGTVRVKLLLEGQEIILRVSDTGCGIAPSDLPQVFKRFWRADSSRSQPGNGLGLALVKAIATSYGGNVTCTSELSRGSVFTVRLPRA